MPLRALVEGEEWLAPLIEDADWESLKQRRPRPDIILGCCGAAGYPRTSKLGTKHFVHQHKAGCDWGPETWQHLLAKTEIVRACREMGYNARTEVSGPDWRADVLATKSKKNDRGEIRIAFEVQWSSQTLEETIARQEKYERDGIRGCWFFKKMPTLEAREDLPIFQLVESGGKFFAVNTGKPYLIDRFIKSLLSKRLRFCQHYRIPANQIIQLFFFPVQCWRCYRNYHAYYLLNDWYSSCCNLWCLDSQTYRRLYNDPSPFHLRSEIVKAAKVFVKSEKGKSVQMGEIKHRYSRTVNPGSTSFGCPWCDAIFGDSFYSKEVKNAYINQCPTIDCETQVTLTENLVVDVPHWCYSENREFCC